MRKCKYRKILAVILAASMTFQYMPSVVAGSGKTNDVISQNDEVTDVEQETEKQPQPHASDESQSNVTSETEKQPQAEINQANDEAGTDLQSLVVDDKVQINSSEDFINLSNEDAANYQNAEIVITRGSGVAFDLTKSIAGGKTFKGFGDQNHPFKGTIKITNAESGIEIPLNRSFFNYLDQSATINDDLNLKAGDNLTRSEERR